MERDDVLLLVRMGDEAGGRVDPTRIARRRLDSTSALAFAETKRLGWLDGEGWVTAAGAEALAQGERRQP